MIIIETFERGARPRAPPPRRRTGHLMPFGHKTPMPLAHAAGSRPATAPFYQIQPHAGPVSANQ